MLQQNAQQIKEKIVAVLRRNGPSLPVHVAKATELSMLFASAFLSELYADKRVRISTMKVGGSPLYYLPGQEPMLDKYYRHLNSKEKEAFDLLRENKVLKDSEQQPAIRVALRSLKDFAIPFKSDEYFYWRYLTVSEEEVRQIFGEKSNLSKEVVVPLVEKQEIELKEILVKETIEEFTQIIVEEPIEVIKESVKVVEPVELDLLEIVEEKKAEEVMFPIELEKPMEKPKMEVMQEKDLKLGLKKELKPELKKEIQIKEKPLIIIKPKPEPKPKPKSSFVLKIQNFLNYKDIEIIEENLSKKREFECTARINSDLGKIELYVIAKEKKKVTENDLTMAVQKCHSNRRIILFLSDGTLDKKAEVYLEKYNNLVRFLKI
jgi:hypothetical protein